MRQLLLFVALLVQVARTEDIRTVTLQGVAVDRISHSPLSKVHVQLMPILGVETMIEVLTDEKGGFKFAGVPLGTYRLFATRSGYAFWEYGRRTITGAGTNLQLRASEPVLDIRMELTKSAAVSGRILNSEGVPVGNADVVAFKPSYRDGRRTLSA